MSSPETTGTYPRLDPLYGPELRRILDTIRLGPSDLARQTGYSLTAVKSWLTGRYPVPYAVGWWLMRKEKAWLVDPPPKRADGATLPPPPQKG